MNLNPFNLFKKTSKGYIGLFLRETDGIIMYLESDEESTYLRKLDSEKFTLTSRWDHLADDVDDALYKLEVRTKKTFDEIIFFVYSHFVEPDTHQLKRQYLSSIKNLVKSMELRPLGFIEVHEAYLKHLLEKNHQPTSALLVESDNTTLSVFTYQTGKLVSQVSTQRKKSFLSDLVETLSTLKETVVLPPRIILLPTKDLSEGADLVEHTWDKNLFNHQPTITIVQEEDVLSSLIQTFSSQILTEDNPSAVNKSHQAAEPAFEEDFTDEEIALDQPEIDSDTISPVATPHEGATERMGFVIGGENETESESYVKSEIIRPAFSTSLSLWGNKIVQLTLKVIEKLKTLPIFRSRALVLHSTIVIGIILILIGGFLIELYLHKATVTLMLPSQKLTLSRSFDAQSLGLMVASESATFDGKSSATGIKNVGEPAKGTVTIFNSSLTQSKTFAKGTKLTGPGNLSFGLDSEVKVASASGDAIDIVSSSSKASVTALAIGPESNLASGTKFTVGDESNSVVIAKNDTNFSGGTKRQIQVVSEGDIAKAQNQINQKAQEFARTSIEKKLGSDAVLLKPLTSISIKSKDVNNGPGVEASSVNVKENVEIGYSYISEAKLKNAIRTALQTKMQKGLTIADGNLAYTITSVTQKSGKISIGVKVNARAVSPVTEQQILSAIRGKTTAGLQDVAKDQYRAQSVEFTIEHPIGFLSNTLPFFSNNIKLKLLYP